MDKKLNIIFLYKNFFLSIFIVYSFVFILNCSAQDTIKYVGNPKLSNGDFYKNPKINSINEYAYYFDGYLVIKINKYFNPHDSVFFYCKIFFIKNLDDIDDTTKHFFYSPLLSFYLIHHFYEVTDKNIKNYIDDFTRLYELFNNANSPEHVSFLYSPSDKFTLETLKTNSIYESGENYFCFKRLRFQTAEFGMDVNLVENGKIVNHKVNVLVPISKRLDINTGKPDNFDDLKLKKINLTLIKK